MKLASVVALFPDLQQVELTTWIERRLVRPEPAGEGEGEWVFHEIDVARVHLIYDLRRNLDVPDDTLPLLLSVLDQLYDLRRKLNAVNVLVDDHPAELRDAIRAILKSGGTEH
ncbi:MAG: chaperone modulator CbpM [Parvibaculum sp.]|nr:chaperone modulator CbpM [Parvibaculum sp.]